MRLRSTGASSPRASPARCGDSSGGILRFLHRSEVPRRAAGPEEVGPTALRARFGQRRGGGECRCCVGAEGALVWLGGGGALRYRVRERCGVSRRGGARSMGRPGIVAVRVAPPPGPVRRTRLTLTVY